MSRCARIQMVAILALAAAASGCGNSASSTTTSAQPTRSKHEQDIYSQQKATCHIEQRFNTIDYRQNNGATNPKGYAEYAAQHGFYLVRTPGEHQAAIDGCLAGLK